MPLRRSSDCNDGSPDPISQRSPPSGRHRDAVARGKHRMKAIGRTERVERARRDDQLLHRRRCDRAVRAIVVNRAPIRADDGEAPRARPRDRRRKGTLQLSSQPLAVAITPDEHGRWSSYVLPRAFLDFSATQDVFFKACSPKNRDERPQDTMSGASDLEAECTFANSAIATMRRARRPRAHVSYVRASASIFS